MTTPRHTLSNGPLPALRLPRAPVLRSRAARGDTAAFASLYQRHHQELYRYCRAILRNDEDAQDALQSAMAKAFAALQHERRDFELRPWLFRIAHNEAISVLRRRRDATHLDAAPEPAMDSLPGTVADRERLAELRADLADLPERQRSALVLRELSGLGHEEIAQVLSSSARAVKQAIFEARTGLAECAEGREMACEAVQRALSDADGRVLRGRRIRAHLRGCRACRQFRAAMEARPADLRALAAPLPVGAGAAVLAAALPGGSATVAGGAGSAAGGALAAGPGAGATAAGGAATAGAATAGGALAGATTSVAGGAFAGLGAKAAIVTAVGVAAVGAARLDGSSGGSAPAARTSGAGSAATAPTRIVPAPLGATTIARRSGAPSALPAAQSEAPGRRTTAPARPHPANTDHASHGHRRAAAAHGHRRTASARGHGSGHPATKPGRTASAARAKHAARAVHPAPPAHPVHPARIARPFHPARAAPPARPVRPRPAAAVPARPAPRVTRPGAAGPAQRPAKWAASRRNATPRGHARPAAAPPAPVATPAHGGPRQGTPPGQAK